MATVCGGSLALMDAGVPLKSACAGIAMGLVVEGDKYAILTDIAGAEDHYGDMDFKVAGTRQGITALQMDIKVGGVSIAMMREGPGAGAQGASANSGHHGQDDFVRASGNFLYAPHLFMLSIPTDKIRDLIGPGGKKIRSIIEATGVKIDVMDDGKVHVFASSGKAAEEALKMIRDVTATAEIGKTYLGKWCASRSSAPSSRFSRAPTACCTSAKSRKRASAPCATN
jgi:polyribonucleotide nucleotidyltransferase